MRIEKEEISSEFSLYDQTRRVCDSIQITMGPASSRDMQQQRQRRMLQQEMLHARFFLAARRGNYDVINNLINTNRINLDKVFEIAFKKNQRQLVKWLLDNKPDIFVFSYDEFASASMIKLFLSHPCINLATCDYVFFTAMRVSEITLLSIITDSKSDTKVDKSMTATRLFLSSKQVTHKVGLESISARIKVLNRMGNKSSCKSDALALSLSFYKVHQEQVKQNIAIISNKNGKTI